MRELRYRVALRRGLRSQSTVTAHRRSQHGRSTGTARAQHGHSIVTVAAQSCTLQHTATHLERLGGSEPEREPDDQLGQAEQGGWHGMRVERWVPKNHKKVGGYEGVMVSVRRWYGGGKRVAR